MKISTQNHDVKEQNSSFILTLNVYAVDKPFWSSHLSSCSSQGGGIDSSQGFISPNLDISAKVRHFSVSQ